MTYLAESSTKVGNGSRTYEGLVTRMDSPMTNR